MKFCYELEIPKEEMSFSVFLLIKSKNECMLKINSLKCVF